MAEAVLYDIAGELAKQLGSATVKQAALWWNFKDELKKLQDTVITIQTVLLDAEEQHRSSNKVRVWIRRLRDVLYDAEYVVDDFATEVLKRQVLSSNMMGRELRLLFSSCNRVLYGYKMGRKVKEIREKIDEIAKDQQQFGFVERQAEMFSSKVRENDAHSFVRKGSVIGREREKMAIIERLKSKSSVGEDVVFIPIVGIGGLGKTMLVRLVYNDGHEVIKDFKTKMWVCVSDDFSLGSILRRALMSEESNLEMLQRNFRKKIEGKKYLLVLDDVWDKDLKTWLALKDILMGGEKGSRIIVTTRSIDVAKAASRFKPLQLQGLSGSDSWSLFKKVVFDGQEPEQHVKQIGLKIIEKCAGVPLAILTIGGLLYSKSPKFEWSDFMETEFSKLPQEANDIMPILQLSYNQLSSPLKHCFAYCKLFPKDFEIDVSCLVQQWVAQGFIRSSQSSRSVEDIGYEYFKDLLGRSFFQEAEKDYLGTVVKCKMHDLMHDLAIFVGGEETYQSFHESTRHISLDRDFSDSSFADLLPTILKASTACTFLLLRGNTSGVTEGDFDKLVGNLKRLLVLDLTSSKIERIPDSIGALRHLRVLLLSNNAFHELPTSITQLLNLQSLQLDRCSNLENLPKDINRLVNLKHLNCDRCDALKSMPQAIEQLTSLQTLKGFKVASFSLISAFASFNSLKNLNDLRGSLKIEEIGILSDFEAANFKEKRHLQSLEVHWDEMLDAEFVDGDHDKLSFQSLSLPPNLKYLTVNCYTGAKFPSWPAYLANLVDIRLHGWRRCKYLPALEGMPRLQTLRIDSFLELEFIEFEHGIHSSFFPSLKRLDVLKCPRLKGWWKKGLHGTQTAAQPHFRSLAELHIRGCNYPFFENFPEPPKLEKLYVISYEGPMFPSWVSVLKNLVEMQIVDWKGCENIPPLDQIPSLERLRLKEFPDLEYIEIGSGSTSFPSLKNLGVFSCPKLRGWRSYYKGTTITLEIPKFHGCPEFDIVDCPTLDALNKQKYFT